MKTKKEIMLYINFFFRTEDLNTEYEHSERIEITDMKEIVRFLR